MEPQKTQKSWSDAEWNKTNEQKKAGGITIPDFKT
jgi:hypothetical protein